MFEYESRLKTYPSNELISNLENLYKNKEITEEKYKSYKNDFETKIKNTDLNLEDFTSLEKIKNKVNTLDNSKREIEANKDNLDKKKQATVKGMGKTKGRVEDISKIISKMEKSLKFTENQTALCPTCQSELTKEHYDNVIQNFNEELGINQKKIEKISQLINDNDKDIEKCQQDLDKINEQITIIQNLKKDFENYQKYDIELTNVQKELYDFVICIDVLEHLREPKLYANYLTELLKPYGRLLIRAPFELDYGGHFADQRHFTVKDIMKELDFDRYEEVNV